MLILTVSGTVQQFNSPKLFATESTESSKSTEGCRGLVKNHAQGDNDKQESHREMVELFLGEKNLQNS